MCYQEGYCLVLDASFIWYCTSRYILTLVDDLTLNKMSPFKNKTHVSENFKRDYLLQEAMGFLMGVIHVMEH